MQTIISEITFTFVDDAAALATGFARLVRTLTVDALVAVRTRATAPIERLALTCDVAGVLSPQKRPSSARTRSRRRPPRRFDLLGIFATFRALRDLT